MTGTTAESSTGSGWLPEFKGGVWIPVGFLLAFTVLVLLSNGLFNWLAGADPSRIAESLWNVPSRLVQIGIVLLVLRYEQVRLEDIGFGRRQLLPALVTVGGFIVAVNAVVAVLILSNGGQLSFEPYGIYRSGPLHYSVLAIGAGGLAQYLFVGPAEELALRGYLQNKLTTLGRGSVRTRTAVAVIGSAVVFSALHIPMLLLVEDVALSQSIGSLVMLTLSGITFGAIYALTRNLVLVAMLHGIGNLWPLVVDPGLAAWPNWGVIIVLYAIAVVLYRRWMAVGDPSPPEQR